MADVGFDHVTPIFRVADVPASIAHYTDVLGFELAWAWGDDAHFDEQAHPTFCCVCRGEVCVFLGEERQGRGGAWILLDVRDVDALEALHDEYVAAGAHIVEPPADRSWGNREMLVEDPDGNVLRIAAQLSAA